ncbi:MAG: thermonuclease family protein [Candidatus Micrarchaeia archaeon]
MIKKILLAFIGLVFWAWCEVVPCRFAYVVDGDTIKVYYQEEKVSVRLIGIDAPESKMNDRVYRQAESFNKSVEKIVEMGQKSKKYAKKILQGREYVYLELDAQIKDKYGRILGYVWLEPDKKQMLNEIMVREGYAVVYTCPPNVKYTERFVKAEREAREKKKGLWREN